MLISIYHCLYISHHYLARAEVTSTWKKKFVARNYHCWNSTQPLSGNATNRKHNRLFARICISPMKTHRNLLLLKPTVNMATKKIEIGHVSDMTREDYAGWRLREVREETLYAGDVQKKQLSEQLFFQWKIEIEANIMPCLYSWKNQAGRMRWKSDGNACKEKKERKKEST